MDVIYERCCGLDIHKASITACVIVGKKKEICTFGTMTDDLLRLTAFLKERNVQMTAMESTGSFWKPIFNIMESVNKIYSSILMGEYDEAAALTETLSETLKTDINKWES